MDLQSFLASLLNPAAGAPTFGPAQAVGDHNNPALLRQMPPPLRIEPPQAPGQPLPGMSQNAGANAGPSGGGLAGLLQTILGPQQQQQQQQPPQMQGQQQPPAGPPQRAPVSQGGGLGDFLQGIIDPSSKARNATVGWLQKQGLDSGAAMVLASDKPALRQYVLQRAKGSEPTEFDQRAAAARQYNLDPASPEGRNFILTGSIAKPESDKPTTDIQNFQFAKQNGYQGSFEQWTKDNKAGVNVNLPGSPNIGTIPPGYAAKQDAAGNWSMVPIPGGPADESLSSAAKADSAATTTDVITGAASKIRTLAKEPGATGIVGAGASYFPNTPAAEVYRQVDVLKSNATISNLNAMRAASPTGGALGNVTEKEGAMLAAKSGALDPKSPYFQSQLDDYEQTLLRVVHGKTEGDRIFAATRQADAGPSRVNNPNPPAGSPDQTKSRPRAINRKTGQSVEWDGTHWVPVQ